MYFDCKSQPEAWCPIYPQGAFCLLIQCASPWQWCLALFRCPFSLIQLLNVGTLYHYCPYHASPVVRVPLNQVSSAAWCPSGGMVVSHSQLAFRSLIAAYLDFGYSVWPACGTHSPLYQLSVLAVVLVQQPPRRPIGIGY